MNFQIAQQEEGRFHQNITFGETGVCLIQVVDFNVNSWSHEILTDNCTVSQIYQDWQFPQGTGPLGEDPAFEANTVAEQTGDNL